MTKYFWREKNALSCADRYEVYSPTEKELERELILKIQQKLERIDVVFNKDARADYYLKDKKLKTIKLEGLSEEEIQLKLGLNVVVDFMQILRDICDFYDMDFLALRGKEVYYTIEEIKSTIQRCIDSLFINADKGRFIESIYSCVVCLAEILNLKFDEIERQRAFKEQKQGNFLLGKYVIVND